MKPQPANVPALLFHKQAVDHFRSGRMTEGIAMMRKALELNPGSGEMHSHLAIALYQTGNMQEAEQHFEKAARLAPRNPDVLNDCGTFLLEREKIQEAERLFRKAAELRPNFADALLNLGRSLQRQGRPAEAEGPFLESLRLNPRSPEALYNLGMLNLRAELPERLRPGQEYLQRAVALNPKLTHAWAGLIRSYEKAGDYENEGKTLNDAEKHLPQNPELAVFRATILLRQKKKDEAAAILQWLSENLEDPGTIAPSTLRDLAHAYDEIGDPARAIHWFRASSEAQKKTYAAYKIRTDDFLDRIEGYRKSLASYGSWRAAPVLAPDLPCPVFLVGFPRSGTTLLDQIFSGHPDIEVAEEKPAIEAAETVISGTGKRQAWEMLDKLDDFGIQAARDAYFQEMRDAGFALRPDRVFIDKLPLNLVLTPVIKRLFPDARFILALRHPCDSVFSNYMQRFTPNKAMVHMIDLRGAAEFYGHCFSAWEEAVSVMGLKFHTIKYEDVVSDLKGEIVKALGFLGLDWQDSVAAFDETAKKRDIRTPSRNQVTQKLYTKARGRWHRYREYMGDVPETLRPWAEKFGYDID